MRGLIEAIIETYSQGLQSHKTNEWITTRATNGINGLVYRASSRLTEQRDLAVKISKRDERDRVGREFAAMQALWKSGIDDVCPFPLLIHRDIEGLPGDVLVAEWLDGEPLHEPPPEEGLDMWTTVLETLAQAHSLTPERCRVKLPNAVFYIRQPIHLLDIVRDRFDKLPEGTTIGCLHHDQITHLVKQIEKHIPAAWIQPPPQGLIICDINPTNMIQTEDGIRLVDWENSGWSDPAMDLGDMLAQPAYLHLSETHQQWICATHAQLLGDMTLPRRAQVYALIMNLFWVVKFSAVIADVDVKKLAGANQLDVSQRIQQQQRYYERCCRLLNITP